MIKPISTIKRKCKDCDGKKEIHNHKLKGKCYINCLGKKCKSCKSTGQQKTEITPLRDFEKCPCKDCHSFFHMAMDIVTNEKLSETCPDCQFWCKGTGYKIPFKDYEIKKVSEMVHIASGFFPNHDLFKMLENKYNLKDEDKLVVRKKW